MTHKSHIRVVTMSYKSLPLCLSSSNKSLFHIMHISDNSLFVLNT